MLGATGYDPLGGQWVGASVQSNGGGVQDVIVTLNPVPGGLKIYSIDVRPARGGGSSSTLATNAIGVDNRLSFTTDIDGGEATAIGSGGLVDFTATRLYISVNIINHRSRSSSTVVMTLTRPGLYPGGQRPEPVDPNNMMLSAAAAAPAAHSAMQPCQAGRAGSGFF